MALFLQFLDQEFFYLATDTNLLIDMFRTDISFLKSNWRMLGRPTVILEISERSFEGALDTFVLKVVRQIEHPNCLDPCC